VKQKDRSFFQLPHQTSCSPDDVTPSGSSSTPAPEANSGGNQAPPASWHVTPDNWSLPGRKFHSKMGKTTREGMKKQRSAQNQM
jgi:hypothetical protein